MPEVETAFYSPANSQLAMVRFPPIADPWSIRFRAGIEPWQGTPPKPPPDARRNALRRSP
jgi:hypothetical protein